MNLNKFLIVLLCCVSLMTANAQRNILSATVPEEMYEPTLEQLEQDNDRPLPYGYVGQRDVLWEKQTWEIIDLDERVNFPLYYPIDTNNIAMNRRSLYDILIKNIKSGYISDIYADSYFAEKTSLKELEAALIDIDTTDLGYDEYNQGLPVSPYNIDTTRVTAYDIQAYQVRGMWYVDKRQGELKYRLLGIAPMSNDVNFLEDTDSEPIALFWVWFPGARDVLHEAKAFNRKNSSAPISFDHLLNSRRFSATVFKEDNVQGDREVREYISNNAMNQLLESNRIRERIRDIEQDLWNY